MIIIGQTVEIEIAHGFSTKRINVTVIRYLSAGMWYVEDEYGHTYVRNLDD